MGLVAVGALHRPRGGSRHLLFLGQKGKEMAPNHPKTAENCPVSARFRRPSPLLPARPVRAARAFLGPSPRWVPLGTVTSSQPLGPHAIHTLSHHNLRKAFWVEKSRF